MSTHPTEHPIYVTRPSLPPLDGLFESLREIWDSGQLTNNGPFHQRFEVALAKHLGVKHVSLFCNGTVALQVGLQALEVTGEVITTPFTFPATTHAIHWNHCTPVFCDIEPTRCNLDPDKLEELITPNTSCILPVHVYGNPCDVHRLQEIATKHGLKLFYDAAHAFGVKLNGESILNFGDLSMLSFHATKVFNTIEGGALITNDPELKQRIDYLKNFGFANETSVIAPGINGKMNEVQAAYGLLQLEHIGGEIHKRWQLTQAYRNGLSGIPGLRLLDDVLGVTHNYSYLPVFVDQQEYGITRDDLCAHLRTRGIWARRYFYPLVSDFVASLQPGRSTAQLFEFAPMLAGQVLCLPLYSQLDLTSVERVLQALTDRP